ncbi:50S ribosomal protein L25/general stress protein Ctc [Ectothiorhodospiraceae bacterium 2226]|nr:50S ribosomal protein L25/general stress protein Ctc [Ectothiorhodospiraceae bacterium 2226]
MTAQFVLNGEPRADVGKGASRRLRRAGKVPAVIYGAGKDPQSITLEQREILKQLENEAVYSHILDLKLGGKAERVVLKDMQRHPFKPIVLHVDLLRVSENEALRVHVPLHFMGEDTAPGVKAGGIVSRNIIEAEISCLPKDLPEFLEVDLSGLNVGDSVHLSDIKLPKGVELPELAHGPEHDLPVASISLPRGAVEAAGEEAEGEESPAE